MPSTEKQPHAATSPTVTIAFLKQFGFTDVGDPSDPGYFVMKQEKAYSMPYIREHVVDGKTVWEDTVVTVEVGDSFGVRLKYDGSSQDDFEQYDDYNSAAALSILEDAGVLFSPPKGGVLHAT